MGLLFLLFLVFLGPGRFRLHLDVGETAVDLDDVLARPADDDLRALCFVFW
jgi:hypothetical protein